jgi:hypothetical protein
MRKKRGKAKWKKKKKAKAPFFREVSPEASLPGRHTISSRSHLASFLYRLARWEREEMSNLFSTLKSSSFLRSRRDEGFFFFAKAFLL